MKDIKGDENMDDERIVELYLLRDETAIAETKAKFGTRLKNLSFGIVGDMMAAEECENDTYLGAWNAIPPHEPKNYLYAFLARIVRNISLNRCRNEKRLKRYAHVISLGEELDECIASVDDTACRIDDIALGEAINGFLGTLNEDKRRIFVRRYFFCDSLNEISRRFGMSDSKVRTTLFRCRVKLREYLEREGYDL